MRDFRKGGFCKVIDAHCHLMDMKNMDFSQLLGMEAIANCGYDVFSSTKAIGMKAENVAGKTRLYAIVGMGPQKCMGQDVMQKITEVGKLAMENSKEIDAIGEIGLDYHWADTEEKRRFQRMAFGALIALSKDLKKPVVIHSRKTTRECIRMLDEARVENGVMFHFFSGNAEEALEIADRGWLISLPPLFGKEKLDVARKIGLESVAAETDAPYVGKTPLDVRKSIQMIADAKETGFEEVEKETGKNVRRFFEMG